MRYSLFILLNLSLTITVAYSQADRKAIREGNSQFKKGEYVDAEVSYRSALEMNPASFKANFNLGDALYKQEKYDEAAKVFEELSSVSIDPITKSKVYHNLGNSHFKQQNFGESVEAYKNALRHNPNDNETKYNLSQAQRMLVQQQQNQSCDNNQNSEDKNDDKQEKKDQQQDQDKQDQNKEDKQDQQKQDRKQQEQQEQQISQEDARRMLEAIQNNEKEVQDRVREEQARQQKVKVERNW